jgi:hypothetical protein
MRYFSVFDVFSMFVHVDYFLLLPSVYLSILIYDFFLSWIDIFCLSMKQRQTHTLHLCLYQDEHSRDS